MFHCYLCKSLCWYHDTYVLTFLIGLWRYGTVYRVLTRHWSMTKWSESGMIPIWKICFWFYQWLLFHCVFNVRVFLFMKCLLCQKWWNKRVHICIQWQGHFFDTGLSKTNKNNVCIGQARFWHAIEQRNISINKIEK